MQIEEICEKLETLLSTRQATQEKLEVSVDALCRIFSVQRSEVAIFTLDRAADSFAFLWPVEMRKSGCIPLSATRSLVSVTAREKRCLINNSFASTPHLFVFEAFGKMKEAPIQKIMSVPMLDGDELKGVLQVSRKGTNEVTLKNFSEPEAQALGQIANIISRYI